MRVRAGIAHVIFDKSPTCVVGIVLQHPSEHKVVKEPMIRLGNPFDDPVGKSGPDTGLPQG